MMAATAAISSQSAHVVGRLVPRSMDLQMRALIILCDGRVKGACLSLFLDSFDV